MDVMMFVLWFAVGFVFGSVPSGLWLVKAAKISAVPMFSVLLAPKPRHLCFCATRARALLPL